MRKNVLWATGLLPLPLAGAAQTATEQPRFYLGAGVSVLTGWPFHTGGAYNPTGPALTAGMRLSPRLALQIGAAVAWNHSQYNSSFDPAIGSSLNSFYSSENKSTFYTVPVLLRYTFTSGAGPLRFDALGGLTLLHARGHGNATVVTNGQKTFDRDFDYTDTNVKLTLGPAVRYALSPALELTATPLVNVELHSGYNFSNRFSSNFLLGVNYKFGQ